MSQQNQGDVVCTQCGTPNRGGAKFCRICGALLPAPAPAAPEDAATEPLGRGAAPQRATPPPAPTPQRPDASPTLVGVPPPAPPTKAAPPGRSGPPWLLIFGGAAVLLVLLAVCVGGGLWMLGQQQRAAAVPTRAPADATVPPEDTPEPAEPTATDEPSGLVQDATAEPAGADADATAQAEARGTAVAERQTAIAGALAGAVPTAEPTAEPTPEPVELAPEPGSLALADYQAEVGAFGQRLFETFDRGERTKAIWTQFENESVAARLRDNFYALTVKGENKNMWETWDRDLGDTYNVELAVAFQDPGVPTAVGIAYDVQEGGDNGVFFEVFNDKHWQLRTVQDGRLVRELSTGRIPVPEAQDGVGTNVLWVVRRPEGVQLWINSTHVATVPAGPFAGGRAGVVASSRAGLAGQATLIADNFRARTP